MNPDKWYYVTPYKKRAGPYSKKRLINLYEKDKILSTTLVWSPGLDGWKKFSEIFEEIIPPTLNPNIPPPIMGEDFDQSYANPVNQSIISGRSDRFADWSWIIITLLIQFLFVMFVYTTIGKSGHIQGYDIDMRPSIAFLTSLIVGLISMLWPGIPIMVRRCHDFSFSGWWVFLAFVPYLGLVFIIILGIVPGAPTENTYGAPPS